MKKLQKEIIVLILIIPAAILTIFLILSGISVKEMPLWAIIVIPTLILLSPFTFMMSSRYAQLTYNLPLQKRKKRILTVLCALIFFSGIILTVTYYLVPYFFWIILFVMVLPMMFFIFLGNFRLFFPKDKKIFEDKG